MVSDLACPYISIYFHLFQVKEVKEAHVVALVSTLRVPTKEMAEGMMAATAQYACKLYLLLLCIISDNRCTSPLFTPLLKDPLALLH